LKTSFTLDTEARSGGSNPTAGSSFKVADFLWLGWGMKFLGTFLRLVAHVMV
jgi:hypothetical protein